MAQLGEQFDADQVEPMQERNFDPIPVGEYAAQIVNSEMRATAKNDGQYLNIEWMLIDEGPYQNRRIWTKLNLVNNSAIAVDIARKELGSICRAVGRPQVVDSAELHDLPCIIKMRIKPAKGDYPAGNEITAYKPINGTTPAQPYQQPAAAPAPRPAPAQYGQRPAAAQPSRQPVGAGAGGAPPWQRK